MPSIGRETVSRVKLAGAFMADSLRISSDAHGNGISHVGRVNSLFSDFLLGPVMVSRARVLIPATHANMTFDRKEKFRRYALDPPSMGTPSCSFANQAKEANMQFHIENMTCFGCARSVTKAIQSVDKHAVIKADPENRKIEVETSAARAEIEAVLAEAGYPAAREAA